MKVTRITQQIKQRDRYSIYIDASYGFSLSEQALLEGGLAPGMELTETEVAEWKRRSADDKLYMKTLRYAAYRLRSSWEIATYLQRHDASPDLVDSILNKLRIIGLLNDREFARAFVANRQLLRPASKLKLQHELRAKHLTDDLISEAIGTDRTGEQDALRALINKKRRLSRYRVDQQKLTQYLARQGFSYEDIKAELGTHGGEVD